MKHTFIVDHNVIQFAVAGTNDQEDEDYTCAEVIGAIAKNCHRVPKTEAIYQRQLSKLAVEQSRSSFRFPQAGMLANVWRGVLQNAVKSPWVQESDLPDLDAECRQQVKDDDHDFLQLAIHQQAPLITTDGPLRVAIVQLGVAREWSWQAITPDEALPIAEEPGGE